MRPRGIRDSEAGISCVTEDRTARGLILQEPTLKNISLAKLFGIARNSILDKRREAKVAEGNRKQFAIRTPGVQQKVVTARLQSATPKAGIGFEIGAIAAVFIGGAAMA